jgi:uncharacterized protein YegJ (DUF2314 family)
MGFFSKLFGKKDNIIRQRPNEPDVFTIETENDKMNWAMEKARLTLHYFEDCLRKPRAEQDYFSIKVKIDDNGIVEHIWLSEPNFDDEGNLFGIVGNVPIDVKSVSIGQNIGIDRTLISDWMIMEKGRLIGGYTIRAIRENIKGKDLANFDSQLGGMIIDDGEDYFLPSNTTPEGAIVMIEDAFNQNDLEKAIACKDFEKEAEIMLSTILKENITKEMIQSTGEVLKLSFIKHMQENGIPKFNHLKVAFPKREKISEDHYIITEVCYYPDGGKSVQRLNTCKTDSGWKVLAPAD